MRQAQQILPFIFSLLIVGCDQKASVDHKTDDAQATIVTLNYPLFYFAEQLAAGIAVVTLPTPGDIDPALWNPQLNDIVKMQQAELIILNGVGHPGWLDKVTLPPAKIVEAGRSVKEQWIPLHAQPTHSHGPSGEHSGSGLAISLWMDVDLASKQADAIAGALIQRWPKHETLIRQRQAALAIRLATLDQSYQQQAKRLANKSLIYSHPVYAYFERRYQLPGHSLHWEPDVMPNQKEWSDLERLIAGRENALFVWEDFPSPAIEQRMKVIDLEYVVVRPAANSSAKSWIDEQLANLQRLESCCQTAPR